MSKYEEISKLASKYSSDIFSLKEECQKFAGVFSKGYVEYLEIPEGRYSHAELSSDLDVIKHDCGFGSHPNVTRAPDGFWYFGLSIRLQAQDNNALLNEVWEIGITKDQDAFIVKIDNTDHRVENEKSIKSIYEKMYESSLEDLKKPVTSALKRIGFVQ